MNGHDNLDDAVAALVASGIKPGQRYRHYKGAVYVVTQIGISEGALEPMVGYKREDSTDEWIWFRTLINFKSRAITKREGATEADVVTRFTRIE